MTKRKRIIPSLLLTAVLLVAGCGGNESQAKDSAASVRIGYFPNLTHLSVIVALENDYYTEELGSGIDIETKVFPDGGVFMEAMSTNEIDVGTVGPTPVLNNYTKNPAQHLLAGAVNAGAVLVVAEDSGIERVEDLDGKRVAIPAFGGTQDIMLMKVLQDVGLAVKDSGGTVRTMAQAPADTAALFLQHDVDAAATQEPWGVNLEDSANAVMLLDAEDFAWGAESTNTIFVGTKKFTENNPELTRKLLQAHIRAIRFIQDNPDEAAQLFIRHIKAITGKEMALDAIQRAMARTIPTYAINEQVLQEMASISKAAGYIASDDIDGLVNLDYLEGALKNVQ